MNQNIKFNGKKLLVLGATASEISLVKRAQMYGIHVTVTDYNVDHKTSPAKDIADEFWDVSWSDLDELEKRCRENKIDGICAGYSEFRVENQILLCERLGLPCYLNMEQLDITRDKEKFKNICRKNGVPVVKEYKNIDEVDEFPVIVKPVDRGGSIGISVATNFEELKKSYDYAMALSVSKNVIIEKYISTGIKIDFYYAIVEGKVILLTTDDTINAKENGYERVVQSAWLFPSKNHAMLVEKTDVVLRKMIEDIGIKNGYIFISGFLDENDSVMIFETGFRLCGGHIYNFLENSGMINNLDLFIFHALTGRTDQFLILNEKETISELKCININIYAKKGRIASIEGIDNIKAMKDCKFALVSGVLGQECKDDQAILSKVAMFYFCNQDAQKLQEDVESAYSYFRLIDEKGNDMIYDRIDPSVISTWW